MTEPIVGILKNHRQIILDLKEHKDNNKPCRCKKCVEKKMKLFALEVLMFFHLPDNIITSVKNFNNI